MTIDFDFVEPFYNPLGTTKNSINISPMQAGDLEKVWEIEKSIYDFPWTLGHFKDVLQAGYDTGVLRYENVIAGYIVSMGVVDEAHLLNISISNIYQRCGLGRFLLNHLMIMARKQNKRSLLLEVRPSNSIAFNFYQKTGFKKIGLRKNYYPAQHGREDAIVMRLCLDSLST